MHQSDTDRRDGRRLHEPVLTAIGLQLVLVITMLSVAHHVDHAVRGVTGWPVEGGFNPFSASLLVYPVIAAGLLLSRRRRVGLRFWVVLAGGGALFVLLVHAGPWAGDSVADIPKAHDSVAASALALGVLAALLVSLVAHCAHEARRLRR